MAKIKFTGFDQTKATATAALVASAEHPGTLYFNDDGTIVINSQVYAKGKVQGAFVNGASAAFDPDHEGYLLINTPTNFIPTSQKGVANGVATLNESGMVPSSQLPSYVDDIIEVDEVIAFDDQDSPYGTVFFKPNTPENIVRQGHNADSEYLADGETGKLYIVFAPYDSSDYNNKLVRKSSHTYEFEPATVDAQNPSAPIVEESKIYVNTYNNLLYRCSNLTYASVAEVSQSLALGETSNTAYRGDRGKATYDAVVTNLLNTTNGGVRVISSASDTVLASEKAIRAAIDNKTVDYNHLDTTLQGKIDDYDEHVNDASDMSALSRGLYKIAITEKGHISDASGNTPQAVTKADLTGLGVEDASNKVTSLSTSSTDVQYPSAKCVWDLIKALQDRCSDLEDALTIEVVTASEEESS